MPPVPPADPPAAPLVVEPGVAPVELAPPLIAPVDAPVEPAAPLAPGAAVASAAPVEPEPAEVVAEVSAAPLFASADFLAQAPRARRPTLAAAMVTFENLFMVTVL